MSVYAVRTRVAHDSHWNLQAVFTSREEADRYAASVVNAITDEGKRGFAEAEIEEYPQLADVPLELPEDQVTPVVSRHTSGPEVD